MSDTDDAAFLRDDGSRIGAGDPDCLVVLVRLGILEVVEDTGDPGTSKYRMLDSEGVGRALAELGF